MTNKGVIVVVLAFLLPALVALSLAVWGWLVPARPRSTEEGGKK